MNKNRLSKISNTINSIEGIIETIEYILSDEQECYDNMPENLQYSSNGERSQNAIDNLEYSIQELESAKDILLEIE